MKNKKYLRLCELCIYMIPEDHATCAQSGKEAENVPRMMGFLATHVYSPGLCTAVERESRFLESV